MFRKLKARFLCLFKGHEPQRYIYCLPRQNRKRKSWFKKRIVYRCLRCDRWVRSPLSERL